MKTEITPIDRKAIAVKVRLAQLRVEELERQLEKATVAEFDRINGLLRAANLKLEALQQRLNDPKGYQPNYSINTNPNHNHYAN